MTTAQIPSTTVALLEEAGKRLAAESEVNRLRMALESEQRMTDILRYKIRILQARLEIALNK